MKAASDLLASIWCQPGKDLGNEQCPHFFDDVVKERLIHEREKSFSFDIGLLPSSDSNGIPNDKAVC